MNKSTFHKSGVFCAYVYLAEHRKAGDIKTDKDIRLENKVPRASMNENIMFTCYFSLNYSIKEKYFKRTHVSRFPSSYLPTSQSEIKLNLMLLMLVARIKYQYRFKKQQHLSFWQVNQNTLERKDSDMLVDI